MMNTEDNRGDFPAEDMMGHSYGHQMTAKEQERASAVEEKSEGWKLEDRRKGYLKVRRRLIERRNKESAIADLRKSLDYTSGDDFL